MTGRGKVVVVVIGSRLNAETEINLRHEQ